MLMFLFTYEFCRQLLGYAHTVDINLGMYMHTGTVTDTKTDLGTDMDTATDTAKDKDTAIDMDN
jgi:hypothetical protein